MKKQNESAVAPLGQEYPLVQIMEELKHLWNLQKFAKIVNGMKEIPVFGL